jgi:hypothetical protein
MWVILALSWLLDRSLRAMNEQPVKKLEPPASLAVPITSCDIRERRQRN